LICNLILVPTWGHTETCNVPSSYPTIHAALEVVNCTEIILEPGTHQGHVTIDRSLLLQGNGSSSTTVVGKVQVQGTSTQVELDALTIAIGPKASPSDGLVVVGDAEVIPDDLVIGVGASSAAFWDGFERGNTTAWSSTVLGS
jgi:hypothetical protein